MSEKSDSNPLKEGLLLREHEYRSLAENLPDNIARWDTEGRYIYVNSVCERTLETPLANLVGKHINEVFADGHFAPLVAGIAHVVATGETITTLRQATLLANGVTQIHDIKLLPERDASGKIIGVLGLGRDMTGFYRLQDELEAKEKELRALADSTPGMMGSFYARPDGSICMPYVSPNIENLFGLRPQDVAVDASPLLALNHPDDAQRVKDSIAESARSMNTWHEEFRILHPTRGERWIESNTHPQLHPAGGIIWYGYLHDITERKRMEQELKLKELVIDHAHDASYLMVQEQFVYVNEAACSSLGYSREELLALTLKDIDPDFSAATEEKQVIMNKLFAQGFVIHEARHRRRDGSSFPVEIHASLLGNQGKDTVLSVARDITDRKRLEQALISSEREYRSLTENLPDNIARWDVEGRILYSNSIHQRTLGRSAVDLIGKTHREAFPDGGYDPVDAGIARVVATGQAVSFVRQPVPFENGRIEIHDVTLVPERDTAGNVISVLGIGRNMTDLYRLQDGLRRSQEMLTEAQKLALLGSWDWDVVTNRVEWSEMAYEIYTPDKRPDEPGFDDFKSSLHADDLERVVAAVQAAFDHDTPFDLDHRVVSVSKGIRTVHAHGKVFRDANGKPIRMVGTVQDITERKRMENEIKTSETQLRARSELLHAILESSPDMITFALDRGYRYIAFNSMHKNAMQAIWGNEIALGMNMLEAIGDHSDHNAAKKSFDRALAGECFTLEEAYGDEKLSRQYWQNHYAPMYSAEGNVVGMTCFVMNITERKQAEEALRESNEKLSDLFKLSPLGLALTDMQGRYIEFNEAFRSICGYPTDELLTLDYWTLTPKEYEAKEAEQLESLARIGRYGPYEKEYRQKDGRLIPIQLNGTLITGKDGQKYIWSIVEDIRERKRVEAQLKEKFSQIVELNNRLEINARDLEDHAVEYEAQAIELEASRDQIMQTEAWYRNIVRSAPDGMVVVSETGNIALVNLNIEKMFGYGEGELIGQTIEILLPADTREKHVAQRDRFFASGTRERPMNAVINNLRACRKDGTEFPVNISLSRLPDADGKTGIICAAIRDVSEHKRLQDALIAREQEFRTLCENSPDAIMRYDRECRRIYVNPVCVKLLGRPEAEVLGKTPAQYPPSAHAAAYESALRRVLETGQTAEHEYIWPAQGDTITISQFNIAPEFGTDGKVVGVMAMGRDITERKRMEDALIAREQESRTLIDNSPDNISRYNRECRRTFANQAFAASVEGGVAALLGKTPAEHPGGPNADMYETKIRDTFETGLSSEFELVWPNKDGREICSHVRITPELDAAGNVVTVLTVGRDITELNEHRKRVHQMAFYDSLTSLPNRALFNDRLRQMITDSAWHEHQAGVMLLDLDRFKAVNDTLGHPAGDALLREAASRLTASVRSYDTVARLGGDEFAIMLPEIRSGDDLGRVANKIVDAFKEPFLLDGKEVFVSTSIGIAVYPADSKNGDDLIKQADSAMYFAKHSGRNTFRFYSKDLSDLANEKLLLEGELRRGFARGELELYYQPKVSLADSMLIGSEALLRWNHPQRGTVAPDKFIPIAEDSGLIVEIGERVLRDACLVALEWNGHGKPLHKVAINLSARQFQSNDLVGTVRRALEDTHCAPEWIELEITESLLMDEDSEVMAALQKFREMGITIAIDDFGTGYSSLSYLARFPIDTLKIDRSFTSKVTEGGHHSELVKAIISIAKSLKQKVVAEGVETVEQAGILHTYGCHIAQGYLYSKPIPKTVFDTLPRSFEMVQGK